MFAPFYVLDTDNTEVVYVIVKRVGRELNVTFPKVIAALLIVRVTDNAFVVPATAKLVGKERLATNQTVKTQLVLNMELACTDNVIVKQVGKVFVATSLTNKFTNVSLHVLIMVFMTWKQPNVFVIDIGRDQIVRNLCAI